MNILHTYDYIYMNKQLVEIIDIAGYYCFYAFYPLHLLILYFYRLVGGV